MPTASIFSAPATFSTSPRMASVMSPEGMDCKGSSDCGDSGKILSGPTTLLLSTRPAAICSITKTPTVLLMVLPPVLCYPSFYKSLREIPRRYARLRRASPLGMTGFLYLILSLAPSAQESETESALTSAESTYELPSTVRARHSGYCPESSIPCPTNPDLPVHVTRLLRH